MMVQSINCCIEIKFLRNLKFKSKSGKVAFDSQYYSFLLSATLFMMPYLKDVGDLNLSLVY